MCANGTYSTVKIQKKSSNWLSIEKEDILTCSCGYQ